MIPTSTKRWALDGMVMNVVDLGPKTMKDVMNIDRMRPDSIKTGHPENFMKRNRNQKGCSTIESF